MNILILLVALAAFGILGLLYFTSAPPAQIARVVGYAGPALLALVGLVLSLAGRIGVGAPLIMMAVAWYGRQRRIAAQRRTMGRTSTVRSAWLEMELDHDSGDMDGIVLAGRFDGRTLNEMTENELTELAADVRDDRESAELLEAYLDRRMPGWRDGADADARPREPGPRDTAP